LRAVGRLQELTRNRKFGFGNILIFYYMVFMTKSEALVIYDHPGLPLELQTRVIS